ncbi:Peptidoglycan-N-acetylglucosamine deacetylase [Planctomycetales bacterium 10988]|nr:Peptidoglycan-N-acetylglucosamine deacetylase [Planctomycetales bacterium 10988]
MDTTSALRNALTIDVEDYFQVSAFEREIDRSQWDSFESRAVSNTMRLLEIFAEENVKGTFYVLGWVAEKYPQLVREIAAAGHELASHSYWHRLVYEQSPRQFREDLKRSKDILENLSNQAITSFRAASFSITERSLWALEILVEEGFTLDSSIFPVYHDRYGIPDANPEIHQQLTPSGSIDEFPPSVYPIGKWNLPISGGGYFRLYPLPWSLYCLKQVNQVHQRPFVFYLHPWEIDPEQPKLNAGSKLSRWRHCVNLHSTERKLRSLVQTFSFAPISEVVQQVKDDHLNCKAGASQKPGVSPLPASLS